MRRDSSIRGCDAGGFPPDRLTVGSQVVKSPEFGFEELYESSGYTVSSCL